MKTKAILLLLFALPFALRAQPATAEVRAAAETALRNGVPQGAIAPLKEAIRKGTGSRAELSRLLARLQMAAGLPGEALTTLDASGEQGNSEWKILRAAALAAEGGKAAAIKLLEPLAPGDPEAALLLARIFAESGDPARAREILAQAPAKSPEDPQRARLSLELSLSMQDHAQTGALLREYATKSLLPPPELKTVEGRLLLEQKNGAAAMTAFNAALQSPDIPPGVRDNARLGLARAAALSGDNSKAREILRESLAAGMTPYALRPAMEEWVALERAAGIDPSGDLRSWGAKKDEPRGGEATLQLARLDLDTKGTEAALASLQELLALPELDADVRERAALMVAEAKIAAGQPAEALTLLESADTETDYDTNMLRGRAHAATGSSRRAYEAFNAAVGSAGTSAAKSAAAANAFITALATEDLALAREAEQKLRETAPDDPQLLQWSFLLAAAEAREGRIDDLSVLARRAPSTDYAFQAKLALAEWRLARGEAEAAQRILKTAEPEAVTPPRAAALEAAEIFTADNAGSQSRGELITACEEFLAKYPDAPEATDMNFKLAELHSRGGDHAAAETILAQLAEKPDQDESALAKFLAAQAASRSMSEAATDRALVWFNELAQGQSELRYRARFEQASLLLRQRKFADALALQDSILASEPPDEVRHAARMERGDILFALGATEPGKLDEAAAAYAELASDEAVPADWRDQAACKRAAALARRGQAEKALALYREILDRPPSQGSDQFWFLKAGLEAARLLEEQKDWSAAVAIYDLMASASGAQREELEQRARKLRLEHFIWEN
jgi:predicted negative regulator of RcsB-dependent stress response